MPAQIEHHSVHKGHKDEHTAYAHFIHSMGGKGEKEGGTIEYISKTCMAWSMRRERLFRCLASLRGVLHTHGWLVVWRETVHTCLKLHCIEELGTNRILH